MKAEWVTKRLGEVAKTQYGLSESMNENGKGFKIFRMGEVQEGRLIDTGRMKYVDIGRQEFEQYQLRPGDVLFNRTNSFELVGKTGIFALDGDYCFASYLVRLNLDRKKVLPEFLNYFMNSDRFQKSVKEKASQSINQANINATILSNELVHFPESLLEQQRIVGILDEAFEGTTTAKANAEKNLQNARALFESFLHSEHADKAFLGDLVNIKTGKLDSNAAVEGGKYPFFTCSRDIFAIDTYAFDCEAILLAGNNAVGDFNVKHYNGKFNAYQRTYVITVNEKKRVLYRFLYFQMLKSLKKFKAQSVGAGTKFLKLGMIKDLEIALPSLDEQQRIVSTMDSVREETEHLASLYQRKLAALEALQKSLLHDAFSGKL